MQTTGLLCCNGTCQQVTSCQLTIVTATLPNGQAGQPYSATVQWTGGQTPYTFTWGGTLPPGLNFNATGTLSGIPQQAGTYSFPVTVTDSSNPPQSATKTISVTIAPGATVGHLYWTNSPDGTIDRANLDGTNQQTLVTGQGSLVGVAVDSSHIYWANNTTDPYNPIGTIMRANLDGTNQQTLITGIYPFGVAVDSSRIYWTQGYLIMAANLDGSGVTTLVHLLNNGVAAGVAVDSSHIYWADNHNDTIMSAGLGGGGVTTLVTNQLSPLGVAVDASHIYWPAGNALMMANLDGTGVTTLRQSNAYFVAVGP